MRTQLAINKIRQAVKIVEPLIHVITHPIVIKDTANVILGLGGRPIMVEHKDEVAAVTASAQALAVSLGNITEGRATSIPLAVDAAATAGIPVVLDLVGVGISKIRMQLARRLIVHPSVKVIKGNISEILAVQDLPANPQGIDAGTEDKLLASNSATVAQIARKLAVASKATVLITGAKDVIADERKVYLVENGIPRLASITGTGCLLTGIIATYLAVAEPTEATCTACVLMGIAGETADSGDEAHPCGNATYNINLLDQLALISDEQLQAGAKIFEFKGDYSNRIQ